MDDKLAIGIAAILVTLIGGFGGVMMKLGRLELKINLMWDWYTTQMPPMRTGGRRRYDPDPPDTGDDTR